jgi:hypothetical protein
MNPTFFYISFGFITSMKGLVDGNVRTKIAVDLTKCPSKELSPSL